MRGELPRTQCVQRLLPQTSTSRASSSRSYSLRADMCVRCYMSPAQMSVRLRAWFALVHCTVGCAGTVDYGHSDGQGGFGNASGPAGASRGGSASAGSTSSAFDAGLHEFSARGCADAGAPVEVDQCDAFSGATGCPPGLICGELDVQGFGACS